MRTDNWWTCAWRSLGTCGVVWREEVAVDQNFMRRGGPDGQREEGGGRRASARVLPS